MRYYLVWNEELDGWGIGDVPVAIPDPDAEEHVVVACGPGTYAIEKGFIVMHPEACSCKQCKERGKRQQGLDKK